MNAPPSPAPPALAPAGGARRRLAGRGLLLVVALAAAGLGLRLWVLLPSLGSNDIVAWREFAQAIGQHSLRWCYENLPLYNHPPLPGYYAWLMLEAEGRLGLRFEVGFKLLPLAADVLTAVLLFRLGRRQGAGTAAAALAVFAFSLTSILITSHHGNTDSVLAALVLLAAVLLDRDRPLAAGLALGGAISVKLVPAILVPLFLARCCGHRDRGRLLLGLVPAALPFVPFLLTSGKAFFANAIAYNTHATRWGLYALLEQGTASRHVKAYTEDLLPLFRNHGRFLILAAIAALAVAAARRRRWSAVELSALGLVAFLVLAPGLGVQYLVYPLPVLIAARLGRGLVYSLSSSLFLLVVYHEFWTGTRPWYSLFPGAFLPWVAVLLGMICWTVLVGIAADLLAPSARRLPSPASPCTPPS